ncbi:MAG: sensor histidine kinase [Actinomycetota bacterium]
MKRILKSYSLVTRFAVVSLVAFVFIGAALALLLIGEIRRNQEEAGHRHARFVAHALLQPEVRWSDVSGTPLTPQRKTVLRDYVEDRVLSERVKRVKLWAPDGTIVYSDAGGLVDKRFPVEGELKAAFGGGVQKGVTDLREEENTYEKGFGPVLLETYVPLEIGTPDGRIDAVLEIYQEYEVIQARISRLSVVLGITLVAGLLTLYVLLLPILRRVARALSEQKLRVEEQAQRLSEHLDKERETVAELQELNRLKGEFIAVASHELRTPLTAIVGSLKMLQRPDVADDPGMRREFLETAGRQADHLHGLVETLLTTSRLEGGQVKVSPAAFSLRELLDEVLESSGAAPGRVRVFMPATLPPLWSDRPAVRQILVNLLDNALKFSPEESPVEIGAARMDDTVTLWVRDRGVGVAPEKLEQIFDRFFQVDSSATRTYQGFGLGLSLVKDLLDHVGGTIDVRSEPGEGSTFTVGLPLRCPKASGAAPAASDPRVAAMSAEEMPQAGSSQPRPERTAAGGATG